MEKWKEDELRALFQVYEVCGPDDPLLERTKRLMKEEMARQTVAVPVRLHGWMVVLLGIALLMALNLFYAMTVGTFLRLALPPEWTKILTSSMFICAAVEICLVAGTLMIIVFTQFRPAYERGQLST